ncbi:type II toxin-antitoxin system Phd/YefM family antitoxin [Microbacterium sp. NPDC089987]|uniref:type II toxin-antitoxin system Phd/YefM family antitoxin n=1 Tax=Microbacterium sp. NPDC089987 TaxID=3364202 RepID=UPI003810A849
MEQVGIRQLKANLSAYVNTARNGDRVVITDRGVAVAEIVPIEGNDLLQDLIDEGLATRPAHAGRSRPRPRATGVGLSDLVAEQRR